MKVLVTGARGLLGRAIVEELNKRNWPAVALGRAELDITDLAAVRQALALHRPEKVSPGLHGRSVRFPRAGRPALHRRNASGAEQPLLR
jgi:dTDP-4-dehydrorhamnose reductase